MQFAPACWSFFGIAVISFGMSQPIHLQHVIAKTHRKVKEIMRNARDFGDQMLKMVTRQHAREDELVDVIRKPTAHERAAGRGAEVEHVCDSRE